MDKWDPIGVSGVPEAQDEYDGYIGGIYRLLASRAKEKQIIDHLYKIETQNMESESSKKGHKEVVKALMKIYEFLAAYNKTDAPDRKNLRGLSLKFLAV